MKCQNCGHNNLPDATQCARCGQPLLGNVDPIDIESLYTPVDSSVDDEGKTAIYVAPEDSSIQKSPIVPDSSKTIVKPVSQENGQTIVKQTDQQKNVTVSDVPKTIVKPVLQESTPTIVKAPDQQTPVDSSDASKTIVRPATQEAEKTVIVERKQKEATQKTVCQTIIKCPHCGFYPVLSSSTECPQCKKPLNKIEKEKFEEKPVENIYEKVAVESGKEQEGTICRPFYLNNSVDTKKKEEKPTPMAFKLTLIPENGEQVTAATNIYDGEKVLLNRDNTEPFNMSITSKEQAEVICEQGRWFIENKSKMNTTYLVVERKMELQSGDIIILGNRRFKFEV